VKSVVSSSEKSRVPRAGRHESVLAAVVCLALMMPAILGAKEDPATWTFRGFFVLGDGKEFVSLSRPGHEARWVPVPGNIQGHRIAKLDRAKQVVTLVTSAGEELLVRLEGATIGTVKLQPAPAPEIVETEAGPRVKLPVPAGARPERPTPPGAEVVDVFLAKGTVPSTEGLDWDWIRSDDNPMKKMATVPSISETKNWGKLTPEQRADLIELYRQNGWAITVFVTRSGYIAANFKAITPPPSVEAPDLKRR
jgi:hypothetical protein